MHFRRVCLIINVSADRFGLGFSYDAFNFCTSHVHANVLSFFSYSKHMSCFLLFSLSLSLSLGYTVLRHPNSANLFCLGTLFKVSGHLLLLFLPYPLIFGSMMRRPRRISLRTSKPVEFIQNARSFCRISPTLHYSMSFGLRDGNISVRNSCVVLSCLFRSSTPTYMESISLCLSLYLHSEVHVS